MQTNNLDRQLNVIEQLINADSYNLGDAFFEHIVAKLNTALEADYTFIGTLDEGNKSVSTITLYGNGQLLDNFTYELAHTPCENVVGNSVCSYAKGITDLYPKDELLIQMGIEGYVGVPTFNSKREPTGIIVSLFKSPIEDTSLISTILMLFASRVSAELEHNLLYKDLKSLQTELAEKNAQLLAHQNHLEQLVAERTKELEDTVKHLQSTRFQLIQAEKNASLGVMTAGVAHEINNPLNYILGGYNGLKTLLVEPHSESEDVQTLLNSVKTGVERIDSIVSSLHQFSNTSETVLTDCDIHETIEHCLTILAGSFSNKVTIKKNFYENTLVTKGNNGQLHQVFLNLLTNAEQAITGKGTITISTKVIGQQIQVEIADDGIGIPKNVLPKIMDPFFTTKSPGKGTGLGLSIAYSIIEKHNGSLKITSSSDVGTTALVSLPTP
jgi:signal transduction histidine kinase